MYALSLFLLAYSHLAYYSPPLRFFPYVPTAPLPLLFQPILLDSNMNISYILTPALVFSLKRFRLAPSTTPPSDPVPRAAPASSRTFYRLCQELARGFMLTVTPPPPRRFTSLQQKRAGPAASSFYKKSRICPCF